MNTTLQQQRKALDLSIVVITYRHIAFQEPHSTLTSKN